MTIAVTGRPAIARDQRVEMRGIIGAGIDHREIAGADEMGLRAGEGEGRRIGREHARDERFELDRLAGREVAHAVEMAAAAARNDKVRRAECEEPAPRVAPRWPARLPPWRVQSSSPAWARSSCISVIESSIELSASLRSSALSRWSAHHAAARGLQPGKRRTIGVAFDIGRIGGDRGALCRALGRDLRIRSVQMMMRACRPPD